MRITNSETKQTLRNKMADAKVSIVKLNNSNYSNWKYKMELLLIKEGLWKVIKETAPAPSTTLTTVSNQKDIDDWNVNDDKARAFIGLSVEDDQIAHIRKAKTAAEAWTNLKQYHEKGTLSNKVHLMRRICSLRMDEGGSAVEHINRLQELFMKLSDIGEESLSDKWSVAMLLSSLPRSYDTLITALEARPDPEDELTFALVHHKVIAEFERRANANGGESTDRALKTIAKVQKCFFCKKPGHLKGDCNEYKKWKAKRESGGDGKSSHKVNKAEERQFLFIAKANEAPTSGWILDSGATRHVTNDKKFFLSLDETYSGVIEVGNGEFVEVKGKGSGKLRFMDERDRSREANANDVLYAPAVVGNLLSVRRLVENGMSVEFNERFCEIKSNGRQIGVADQMGNLYRLRQAHAVHSAIEGHKENCIHDWHRKLGQTQFGKCMQMARWKDSVWSTVAFDHHVTHA